MHDAADWQAIARGLYARMQSRKAGTAVLRVFNPDPAKDGWSSPHTAIEIVNDDMPFLVDTVGLAVAQAGMSVHILMHPVPAVTRVEFRDSGFSQAHLRGSTFVGWKTLATLIEHTRRLAVAGEKFVYAYYPGIDEVAHAYGLNDEFYARELAAADALVGNLLDALPSETALLVTADHGQTHLEPESWIDIDELHPMIGAQAGDARFRYLHARKGMTADLLAAAHSAYDDIAWVMSRKEVLEARWIGTGATGTVPGRLGDVILAARAPVAFVDPAMPRERMLRSAHGSLTPQEMWVPLRAARGRA